MANCTRHQQVETYLSCTTCDRPFCYECLIQAAVGSKCGECAKGRPIGSTDTAKGRATVAATELTANRLAPLWIVLGLMAAGNLAMFVAAGPTSAINGIGRYSLSTDAVKLEWWRLFTGAIGHQSVIAVAINLAMTWWLGRFLSPRLRMTRFLTLAAASLAGGALVSLLFVPHGGSFAGLSLSSGMVGAQLAGQRRGSMGALSLPRLQSVGFVGWFFAWFLVSSLFSGIGSFGAILGGLAAGFAVGWVMLERTTAIPNQKAPNEGRHAAIGAAVAVACALLGYGFASSTGSAEVAQGDLRTTGYAPVFTQGEPIGGEPNLFQVTRIKDIGRPEDGQWYGLTCGVTPEAGGDTQIDVDSIAVPACDWITQHADGLAKSPKETCGGNDVTQLKLQGTLADGRPVRAVFEVADKCGAGLSRAAHAALWR